MSITIIEPTINIVIAYKEEVSTLQSETLTNQQALKKISGYLESTTAFLKKRRLANQH